MARQSNLDMQSEVVAKHQKGQFNLLLSIPARLRLLPDVVRVHSIAEPLLLVIVIAAGAFLRLWQINSLGYNSDEAVYAGQGAAIAADPALREIFPIFRAHPLLFQFILAIVFRLYGVNDLIGRLFSMVLGLATIYFVYQLGRLLYGRRAGMIAALVIALMPYHIVVTRQVILDGPMTLFATLSLYLIARYAITERPAWLYAAGGAMGLTFLAKETGIVLIGAIYAFLALCSTIPVRIRDLVLATILMALVIAPHPLALSLAGRTNTANQFLLWQLFRRPNHEWTFYPATVPVAIGPLVILAAVLGLWLFRSEWSWREILLVAWIVVPTLFFQLWPTKGFQYLLPTAPAIATLAGRTLARWPSHTITGRHVRVSAGWLRLVVVAVVSGTLLMASWNVIQTVISERFLAGSGGIPGGREAGEWVLENVPVGAKLVAIGPSMANLIQFYGHRRTYGLSVSSNPLHRNPVYEPVVNLDKRVRSGEVQYLVYDVFSATRTAHFAEALLKYVERYHGRVVHTEIVTITTAEGATIPKPIIVIYEVRP
jgi:hypothetical protein